MSIDKSVDQRFSSRLGLLLSALGIAVGTGNIWRFPRIAAQNGGENGAGALIITWIVFLFLWSIPLIITEYMLGEKYRKGVVGSFAAVLGKKFAWMGSFVGFVAAGISFFYAVILGWAMYFLLQSVLFPLPVDNASSLMVWENFQSGPMPYLFHFLAVGFGALAIWKGIRSIERVNMILIPILLLIILITFVRAITLPGAMEGISYLFRPQWSQLANPEIWLQALTQNAWDTGAGWGLFLTYAAYMKKEHGTVKNAFITGIGNNTVSLLMAVIIFSTVFSVLQHGQGFSDQEVLEVMKTSGPASTGLTFIWIPQLFSSMHYGRVLAIMFFLGLSFAGFSSMISMFELSARVFVDRGMKRSTALWIIIPAVYLLGIPSVMSLDFLSNQDFVWGLGLIISGIFFAIVMAKAGIMRFRKELETVPSDWVLGRWWELTMRYFVPAAGVLLLAWWMMLAATKFAPGEWYNPFKPFSLMTCLLQWFVVIAIFVIWNNKIAGKSE
ncbi:MAG: sodium-dependent transporter [Bacteroidales bacterium]|nr:sodium-dependent transporter [Bacteroidales bacterium]